MTPLITVSVPEIWLLYLFMLLLIDLFVPITDCVLVFNTSIFEMNISLVVFAGACFFSLVCRSVL